MTARPNDTIAAIATPRGEGGVGVVRLSGPDALPIAARLFRSHRGSLPTPLCGHRAYYGSALDTYGRTIDECLLTWFPAPRSYTAEDVVELSCHGSDLALTQLLDAARSLGARLAAPGEFTQRAFLNGRLDLASAEAVMDLIRARTDAALRIAARQAEGHLARAIRALRSAFIGLLAAIEATIDFPDDLDPPDPAEITRQLQDAERQLADLLAGAEMGRLYREGASVVIAGRPNVGKSSLLNALLGEERAIVTPVPGTTRDVIEESINLSGVPVRLIDTAGLRDTADPVESIGVTRTRAQIAGADLTLLVMDASTGTTEEDALAARNVQGRRVWVGNKIDLGDALSEGDAGMLRVSARTGVGLDALKRAILHALAEELYSADSILVSNTRHKAMLDAALAAVREALAGQRAGFELVAVAVDLKIAAEALGEITGETVTEATIAEIFARFCVGK
jgi:tRNA modification GTPase